jgi:hypothetical protein
VVIENCPPLRAKSKSDKRKLVDNLLIRAYPREKRPKIAKQPTPARCSPIIFTNRQEMELPALDFRRQQLDGIGVIFLPPHFKKSPIAPTQSIELTIH